MGHLDVTKNSLSRSIAPLGACDAQEQVLATTGSVVLSPLYRKQTKTMTDNQRNRPGWSYGSNQSDQKQLESFDRPILGV